MKLPHKRWNPNVMLAICVVLVTLGLVNACSKQLQNPRGKTEKQAVADISATAVAETRSDGTIAVRAATNKELASANALNEKFAAVDERFPSPNPPQHGSRLKAVRVVAPGLIYFDGAPTVRIDGIRCSPQGIERIAKKILAPDASVVILPSVAKSPSPIPAVVWVAYSRSDSSGEMFSAIADGALMNNQCEAEFSPTSKYNDRYAALAHAFSAAKK